MNKKKQPPKIKAQISAELYRAVTAECRAKQTSRPETIENIIMSQMANLTNTFGSPKFKQRLLSSRSSSPCAVHFYAGREALRWIEYAMREYSLTSVSACVRGLITAWNDERKDQRNNHPRPLIEEPEQ